MKILIENVYADGHECEETFDLPDEEDWQDRAFELTGCGHGHPDNTPDGRSMAATHIVTVIESDNRALVGQTCEWSG